MTDDTKTFLNGVTVGLSVATWLVLIFVVARHFI